MGGTESTALKSPEDAKIHERIVRVCSEWDVKYVHQVYLKVLKLVEVGALSPEDAGDVSDLSSDEEGEGDEEGTGEAGPGSPLEVVHTWQEEGIGDEKTEQELTSARDDHSGSKERGAASGQRGGGQRRNSETLREHAESEALRTRLRIQQLDGSQMMRRKPKQHLDRRDSASSFHSSSSSLVDAGTKSSMRHVYVTRSEFFDIFGVADYSVIKEDHFLSLPLWLFSVLASRPSASSTDTERVSACDRLPIQRECKNTLRRSICLRSSWLLLCTALVH